MTVLCLFIRFRNQFSPGWSLSRWALSFPLPFLNVQVILMQQRKLIYFHYYSHQPLLFPSTSYLLTIHNKMLQMDAKREKFREQIRREQIQKIFATKRMFRIEHHTHQPHPNPAAQLKFLLNNLQTKKQIHQTLLMIANLIHDDSTFSRFLQQLGSQSLNIFCRDLTFTIFNSILPTFLTKGQQQTSTRLTCLHLLSNLFADTLTPHTALLEILSSGLQTIYGSVSDWGCDNEMVEVGWIVSNVLCQKGLFEDENNEKNIEKILSWAQELIAIHQNEMIVTLYRSLKLFFKHVDEFYSNEGRCVEHYQIYRLIILEKTIELNLNMNLGTSLSNLLSFVTVNLHYFSQCDERLRPILLKNIIKMITSHSEKVVKEVLKILKYLMNENFQSTALILVKNYFNQILINLQYQSIPIKIELIELIKLVCINNEIVDYLVRQRDLEEVLVKLICHSKENQLIIVLANLTWQIMQLSQQKYGMKALDALEEHHAYRTGDVGEVILKLVDLKK